MAALTQSVPHSVRPPFSPFTTKMPTDDSTILTNATSEPRKKRKKTRKKVDPDKRKRIAMACESCKRRKQKCDGAQPCMICEHKDFECVYLRDRTSENVASSPTSSLRSRLSNASSASIITDDKSVAVIPNTVKTNTSNLDEGNDCQVETVGGGHSRMLCDPQGHLRYIGESGALSFLEQTRSVFRKTIGESDFTLDPDRFRFVDGPNHVASIVPIHPPARELADKLIALFVDNVQCLNYVFDMQLFSEQVALVYKNPMRSANNWLCLLYLTCAIGGVFANSKRLLQTRRDTRTDPDPDAEVPTSEFFESGLGMMKDAAEDGEIWVVQAYLLVSIYYQLICKRNVSWVHLGTAIRLAQALGLHRAVLNAQYPKREQKLRERLWRTLYILDRFSSSSLGRPLMVDINDVPDSIDPPESAVDSSDMSIELAKIMHIVGDVCRLVYGTQSISSSASQELATRFRLWSSQLPKHMQFSRAIDDSLLRMRMTPTDSPRKITRQALLQLHLCHLNGIILLTRPFFFFSVVSNIKSDQQINKSIARLSSACVLCAARSVDLVVATFIENEQPTRPPLLIYFIFSAGLILIFEAFNQKFAVEGSIMRGISLCVFILDYYATCDPSALRYKNILVEMDNAVQAAYTSQPDRTTHLGQMEQINQLLLSNYPSRSGTPHEQDDISSMLLRSNDAVETDAMEQFLTSDTTVENYFDLGIDWLTTVADSEFDEFDPLLKGLMLNSEF